MAGIFLALIVAVLGSILGGYILAYINGSIEKPKDFDKVEAFQKSLREDKE